MSYEIKTLAEGELITSPGFYNIPIEVHHSQCCDGVSVTSGILRKMELATPADVFAFHAINPNRWTRPETAALRLGRAMADYVSGGMDEVAKHFAVLPADKPNKPTAQQLVAYAEGRATDAGKKSVEFWEAQSKDPRDQITAAEQKMIEDMGKVLAADPMASAVMGGLPEISMAYQDDQTGLWLLARPDTVNFDGTVTDFKKCNTQGRPFNYRVVDQRITEHGYDMQLAFAAEVFECLTGEWPNSAGIIAQWDAPPHHVILREIAEEDLRIGQFRNLRAITRFAECLASGEWPGPGSDVGAYQRPQWQRDMLLEEMNTEGKAP